MNDMDILELADECGVTAVSKHEWDGKRLNHTDALAGDFICLIKFARLLMAIEREECAEICEKTLEPWLLKEYIEQTVQAIKGGAEKQDPDSDIYDIWVEHKPVHASDMSQERVDETAKRKHEWVGLTDEEIKEIVGPWGDTPIKGYTRKLFDQIEEKLKEKNQ